MLLSVRSNKVVLSSYNQGSTANTTGYHLTIFVDTINIFEDKAMK